MSEPFPRVPSNVVAQAKRALIEAGFEIFRTRGDEIVLAERPRENLILDSGVRLFVGGPFEVRIVLRAQKADFPHEDDAALFARVRKLACSVMAEGYSEAEALVTRVQDPGDAERTLDMFYEIVFSKPAVSMDEALASLRFAVGVEKRVLSTTGSSA
jgi:hypothetical protein